MGNAPDWELSEELPENKFCSKYLVHP